MKRNLLIIDDELNMRHMLQAMLTKNGYNISCAENGVSGLDMVKNSEFDFILCDIRMPEMDGITFLKKTRKYIEDTTIIMMSAYGTIDLAISAMKEGAYDFISKPFKTDEVLLTLKKAEERETLKRENRRLVQKIEEISKENGFSEMVGKCQEMQQLFDQARKAAQYDTTVLITGESGTGKELLAKGIHQHSARKDNKFIAINCGSIPANLWESEFFGYARGAFTGADSDKKGIFEEANGGTLFLDEIGEMPLSLQVKLLRVLQEKEIRPIGAGKHIPIDVRILAATTRNLAAEVEKGDFREDLYFRLNVIAFDIPPLRKRKEDIPFLCKHLLQKLNHKLHLNVASISSEVLAKLMHHSWPGNVRELENVLENGLVFAEGNTMTMGNMPIFCGGTGEELRIDNFFSTHSLKNGKMIMEKWFIGRALEHTGGNKSRAAVLLEISYPSLLAKIKEYNIEWS